MGVSALSTRSVFESQYLWVVDAKDCGGAENIISIARAAGVGICAKWHDGDPSDDGKWDFQGKFGAIAERALTAGIPLLAWGYCYGDAYGNLLKEADAAADVLARYPSVGYVIDAESEWENPKGGEWARRFKQRVDDKVAGARSRMAFTPFWNTRWHPSYPVKELSASCSAIMPQVYFALARRKTRASRNEMVGIALADYKKYGLPVYPIAELASGIDGLIDFIVLANVHHVKAWSWWSLDDFSEGPEIAYLKTLSEKSR